MLSDLTLREMIILVVVVAVVVALAVGIIKKSVQLLITAAVIAFLFSGFTWLPEQVKSWLEGSPTTGNIVNGEIIQDTNEYVNNTMIIVGDTVKTFVDTNKDPWIDSAKSLWNKIQNNENGD